jgi:hypothetical protein
MNTPEQFNIGAGGFGFASQKDLQDLNKALAVDYEMPPTEGANALRAYSIDGTLRSVTYSQKHIKFWTRVSKTKAYSTVEEYVKLKNYGNERAGAFVDAGALPPSQDSSYSRENKNVKYVGTTRAVQHQAMVVETVVVDDLVAQEQVNGTIYLLGVIEKALFEGDSDIIKQEWDGICPEINREYAADTNSDIVIDLEGADITKADLTRASTVVLNNYGTPDVAYLDLLTMGKINALFYPNQFIENVAGGVTGGVAQNQFTYLPQQTFEYVPDVFLRPAEEALLTASSEKAPQAPVVTATTAADTKSKFKNASNSRYIVSAINKYGESVGSQEVTVSIAQGDAVTLNITKQGNLETTGYKIYRADLASDKPKFVKRIVANATAATTQFVDLNNDIPGSGKVILVDSSPLNIQFKQLVPFIKIPLAIVDASVRWMQLLYGTPIVSTPRKNVLIKNINLR